MSTLLFQQKQELTRFVVIVQAQYNEEWYGSRRARPRDVHFGRHRDSLEISKPEAVNKALRERFEAECRNTLFLEMEGTRGGMFALY